MKKILFCCFLSTLLVFFISCKTLREPTNLETFINEYENFQKKTSKEATDIEHTVYSENFNQSILNQPSLESNFLDKYTLDYVLKFLGNPVFQAVRKNELILIYQEHTNKENQPSKGHRAVLTFDLTSQKLTNIIIKKWDYSDVLK